jgi:hypothetical protein
MFSNTLKLCSFRNARDRVSYSYRTKGEIMLLCILAYGFCKYVYVFATQNTGVKP